MTMETTKKDVIGYQIYAFGNALPKGLYSFMVFRDYFNAVDYVNDQHLDKLGFKVVPVYQGDIENPTFI